MEDRGVRSGDGPAAWNGAARPRGRGTHSPPRDSSNVVATTSIATEVVKLLSTDVPDPVVYIVDDDPAARESVAALVESRGMKTLEFASGEAFLEIAREDLLGCVVVDVRMKGMSGLELQDTLISRNIFLPVIVITGYADVPMAVRAMQAGAVSFLTKPCKPEQLWQTISEALERSRKDRQIREHRGAIQRRVDSLTLEERAVLQRVVEGVPNKRIARDLDMGLRTVELRRSSVMKKMQADSLAELVQMVFAIGQFVIEADTPKPKRV